MSANKGHAAVCAVSLVGCLAWPSPGHAQEPFSDSLLPRVRAAAHAIAGPNPRSIHYLPFSGFSAPLGGIIAAPDTETVRGVFAVFQIRFDDSWILVDAGTDRNGLAQFYGANNTIPYQQDQYERVQSALRDAKLVVLTHEHFDHALGVERGPDFATVARHTLLTPAQRQALLAPPVRATFRLGADSASQFQSTPDQLLFPIAPGVVLIQAPGHSQGSQFVYVALANGQEALFIGDLVYNMAGLTRGVQKPRGMSQSMSEDTTAIRREMLWVSGIMAHQHVTVVPCHDAAWLESLVRGHLLMPDLDLAIAHTDRRDR